MSIFDFSKNPGYFLGEVVDVDTRNVTIKVEPGKLKDAHVGKLVTIKVSGTSPEWLIAIVNRIIKTTSFDTEPDDKTDSIAFPIMTEINRVKVLLIGTYCTQKGEIRNYFTRSILTVPDIESECYILEGEELGKFMNIISEKSKGNHALDIGHYTFDPGATAYLEGNKLFQRHAALLGSTGSGKSWTVAKILEKASELPTANIIVFDLHGEYKTLDYAKQLRIAGPDDLDSTDPSVLFLPYWLLNAEELQTMFVDRNEFTAQNQVLVFYEAVVKAKKDVLTKEGKTQVLKSFTIDSPVPFSLESIIKQIQYHNEEMVQGDRGLKQGKFYGQFSRLLVRLGSKISDKRYGFLFQAPTEFHQYSSMHQLAEKLMGFEGKKNQIKVIDFSEVPADILPVIVGLAARLIYQVQFWMDADKRQPIAFICDEAHQYLPKRSETNSIERRALENFEKIAKEGRKYGVGLFVVSQRPSEVNDTILSQCNNFVVLRLTNAEDQAIVKKLLPESLETFTDILPALEIGEALIVGDSILLPSKIKITEPQCKPCSATIDFWKEWSAASKKTNIVQAVENMRKQTRRNL
ncbi:MAG: ATP-binding protein [Acidobacteria bacterium]|nr:ATP-binding protein [Acidobacteriota bacterium]